MKRISLIAGMLLAGAGFITSCKKDKTDYLYDNRIIPDTRNNSGVRIVNLGSFNQVIANGDTLTNYVVLRPNEDKSRYPATKYFPDKGRLSTTWWVPREFFVDKGAAHLKIETKILTGFNEPVELDVKDDYNAPADYYLIRGSSFTTGNIPQINSIPRGVEAPSRPDHFKVRILNLAATIKHPDGNQENISGPLTLAFADGTPVSAATSNINTGQYSGYVEVPYGTYQFKVLTAARTQVTAAAPVRNEGAALIDPATSTITRSNNGIPKVVSTKLTYAPIRTYQPGGIYTIVISPQEIPIPLYNDGTGDESVMTQNAFQIIADIPDPVNHTYGRLQAVNALPGIPALRLKVNGSAAVKSIPYAAAGEYTNVVTGMATITITDDSGKELAVTQKLISPGANYSAWVYADTKGAPQITIAANNLSGGIFVPGGDGQDGSFQRIQFQYPFHFRFYNFCPDFPNVNFTTNNGQLFGRYGITTNLQPGIIPGESANTMAGIVDQPYQIMAFQSSPGVFPGSWITQVPVLTSTDLIARKELYARTGIPDQEPGFYSVALIGRNNAGAPAKMIIVKHNR